MKNKKVLIYVGIVVIILTIIIIIVAIKSNKPMQINNVVVNNTTAAKTLVENLKQKYSNKKYLIQINLMKESLFIKKCMMLIKILKL